MIHTRAALLAGLMALAAMPAAAQPYGIDPRAANSSILINDLPLDTPGTMQAVNVFPQLGFARPLLMGEIPDGSNRLWVAERRGRIRVFPNIANPSAAQSSIFLDIQGRVEDTQSEQGFLGVAFDPEYAANGRIYVHYSYDDGVPPINIGPAITARFTNDNPADNSIDPATEEIILSVPDDFANHNGGMLSFGADNYLYLGLGDGGSGNDPLNRAQDLTQLLGKFLRIDVTGPPQPPLAYAIPPDNPFAGDPPASTRRKEIYAWGMRNPWRWSFDRGSNLLYCADVGQNNYEEIDIIEKGRNYGWRVMEGFNCNPNYPLAGCDPTGKTPPIHEYNHSVGYSITGGFVYYGSAIPSLYGAYVYADYGTRRVWALRYNGSTVTANYALSADIGINIAGFGQDAAGEIYLLDFNFGYIYKLQPTTPPTSSDFPLKLSDDPDLLAAGLGQDQTAEGIIPYEPSAKLWSDGAEKERFIAIPGLGQAGYQQYGGWDFPDKTVILKNFLLDLDESDSGNAPKRIETRLLFRNGGTWRGYTYEWNDAQTDATLLPDSGKDRPFTIVDPGGTPFGYTWRYPSRGQCNQCHTTAANGVLGLNTAQMNFDFHYPASNVTDNQLRTYDHINLFSAPLPDIPANLPKMPDPADTGATIQDRARAYLAANCAMCHQPGSSAPTSLDLRWQTTNAAMNAINAAPGNGDLGVPGALVITPGFPSLSVLYLRMHQRGVSTQMPPLATSRIDEFGSQVIYDWITSLGPTPTPSVSPTPTLTPTISPSPTPTPIPTLSPTISPSLTPTPIPLDAAVMFQTIPSQMAVGETLFAGILMKNTGSTTWIAGHALAVISDPCGLVSPTQVAVPGASPVLPNQTYNFVFQITAPASPGSCQLQFRMLDLPATPFGETLQVTVNIVPASNSAAGWALYE